MKSIRAGTTAAIALEYIDDGLSPIPVPYRKKNPGFKDWQNTRIDEENVAEHFTQAKGNIGILLGCPSGGLVDGDMDTPEAVAAAPWLLPPTRTFGRKSNPASHHLFMADGCATKKFVDPIDRCMLLELRSDGHQTVFPGSTHVSGESIDWTAGTALEPAVVDAPKLMLMFGRLATATLLARHWPKGTRHEASLALAGGLLRSGLSVPETENFVRAVAVAAQDNEVSDRVNCVASTDGKLAAGEEVTGWPTLEKLLGDVIVGQAKEWLNIADSMPSAEPSAPGTKTAKQSHTLIALVLEHCTLFHDSLHTAYARTGDGEVLSLRSEAFGSYLGRLYYTVHKSPVAGSAKTEALATLTGIARWDSPRAETAIRLGAFEQRVYLDLGNNRHEVVEIDATGWRLSTSSPVHFRRPRGMGELPPPARDGNVEELLQLLNPGARKNFTLVLAWLLAALKPHGPYPVLVLQGRHGSAKSTTARILREIIDPNIGSLRAPPSGEHDLVVAARNSWVLAFDNLSGVPDKLSDAFCRLASGGAFSTRELYSDSEEVIFNVSRPLILNGIDDLTSRPDLADRALILPHTELSPPERKTEEKLFSHLKDQHPKLLGLLLDGVVLALRNARNVVMTDVPRMVDAMRWAAAGLPALDSSQAALQKALTRSKAEATVRALEADPLANAVLDFFRQEGHRWGGSSAELLNSLRDRATVDGRRELPTAANTLTNRLNRLAPTLREVGLDVRTPRSATQRRIELVRYP